MATRFPIALLAAVFPSFAPAQETITLDVRLAHATLLPGQSQTVEVWASYAPGPGTLVPWTTPPGQGQMLPVSGFGEAYFDLLNVANAHTGAWSNFMVNPWVNLPGFVATTDPLGNVRGIYAATIFTGLGTPLHLWSATWTPEPGLGPREVALQTQYLFPPRILLGTTTIGASQEWTGVDGSASFLVVPAPATVLLLAAAGGLAPRRR